MKDLENPVGLPRSPAIPADPAPARTGMASSPAPMKPRAKIVEAKWPAKGRSADAA